MRNKIRVEKWGLVRSKMPDDPHAPGYPDDRIGTITHPGGPQRVPKCAYDLSTTIPPDRIFQGNQHFFEKSAYFGSVPQIWLNHLRWGLEGLKFFLRLVRQNTVVK